MVTIAPMTEDLLEEVERIRPVIEEFAAQGEADRQVPDPIYDAMTDAGIFRLLVPKAFGGMELHPVEAYRVWEALARIDSSTGWNAMIASNAALLSAYLPAAGSEEIFAGGPDVVAAGGFFPPAAATRVDGGWRVSGRTPFASGSRRASWLLMPLLEMDGDAPKLDPNTGEPTPMLAYFPRADAELVDTWHTLGMRGTGSGDVAVRDLFVPDHRVGVFRYLSDPPPAFAGPLYRILFQWAVHNETVVSLGVAAAAIDRLVQLAAVKTPNFSSITLRDREMAQHHVAKARALVDASREYIYASISEAYAEAERGERTSADAKLRCQLAACHAAEACAEAVDLIHQAAGSSGIRRDAGFERHFRDIHTLTQHGSKSYARYEDAGKLTFGLPAEIFYLNL